MKPRGIASSHYPDYFKLDLGIGENTVHPLAGALDTACETWIAESHRRANEIDPTTLDPVTRSRALRAWGFQIERLDEAKRAELFRLTVGLIRERTTVSAIETLARLYFEKPTLEIRRGLPYPKRRLTERVRFPLPLADTESRDRLLFVRLAEKAGNALVEEFTANAERLLPLGYRVRVAEPARNVQSVKIGMSVKAPIPLVRRQLACRISQK